MDEAGIIQRVQEGDVDAFGRLMDLHVRRLRAFLALNAPVPHLVDEIAHSAFVFAYQHISEFTRGTSFFAWLKTIAWNLLRAELQRYSREQANQLKYAERRVFEVFPGRTYDQASGEAEHLEACLDRVPPALRELLALRYTFGLSTREIAGRVNHSSAWVRTSLFRLRRQLRECMEKKLAAEKP